MRCLYCGKELALFKRLRGGDFCSDAHRQQYQEEYNELALHRLALANASKPNENANAGKDLRGARPNDPLTPQPAVEPVAAGRVNGIRPSAVFTAPAAVTTSPVVEAPPPAVAESPVPEPQVQEEPAPPTAAFLRLIDLSNPEVWAAKWQGQSIHGQSGHGQPVHGDELASLQNPPGPSLPRLPERADSSAARNLSPGERVEFPRFHAADLPARPIEQGVAVREFTRGVPPVQVIVKPASDSGFDPVDRRIEVEFYEIPPSAEPAPWIALAAEFPALSGPSEILLGDLARLDFELTEWMETAASAADKAATAEQARAAAGESTSRILDSARMEPVVVQTLLQAPEAPQIASPEPLHFEPAHVDPVFLQSIISAPVGEAPEQETSPEPEPLPELVTTPMAITFDGQVPARGKAVQPFTSAVTRANPAQIQPHAALPLRPVMVLMARPVPNTAGKPGPRPAPIPERREARPEPAPRKSDIRVLPMPVKEQAPRAQPIRPEPAVAEVAKKPDVPKPDVPKPEPVRPAPVSDGVDSLGLPQLSFQTKESAWSRLPGAVKLIAIAGVLALIIGGVFLVSRGSSTPTVATAPPSTAPRMVEEPALANDAGWTQDWFVDQPGKAKSRHVDVLRGSLTLRDYRLIFEGQIEQRALGWVFRANNKSFYVEKIQVVTPGLNPTIALVRFAVIDGKEQARTPIPLPLQVHLDTLYKVRMDVIGDHFTTWVQDGKVDEWTDSQVEAGGVGLYYEAGDSSKLKDTLHVIPLRRK